MRAHRTSYLKTTLGAAALCVLTLALAVFGWMWFTHPLLRFACAIGFAAVGLTCLLVAVGGVWALREDAMQIRGEPVLGRFDRGRS